MLIVLPLLLVPLVVLVGYSLQKSAREQAFGCDSPLLLTHYHKDAGREGQSG